ncbi:hypothetical protein GQ53DRAFT_241976 [Thozetella sp. PMI_491]|nr:hypothetical protein GQ53DRAFT_241976 [Thozetella sp. PMI_491]
MACKVSAAVCDSSSVTGWPLSGRCANRTRNNRSGQLIRVSHKLRPFTHPRHKATWHTLLVLPDVVPNAFIDLSPEHSAVCLSQPFHPLVGLSNAEVTNPPTPHFVQQSSRSFGKYVLIPVQENSHTSHTSQLLQTSAAPGHPNSSQAGCTPA